MLAVLQSKIGQGSPETEKLTARENKTEALFINRLEIAKITQLWTSISQNNPLWHQNFGVLYQSTRHFRHVCQIKTKFRMGEPHSIQAPKWV